jgi:flagellar FliJ protein
MFKFPLQRLLELRAAHEREMARQLASARDVAESERRSHETLAAAHEAAQQHIARSTNEIPTVGHLVSLNIALTQLSVQLDQAGQRAREAEAVVEQRRQGLTSASQDRQVLDRLRERRLAEHRDNETMRDRLAMDEIALSRFTRQHQHGGSKEKPGS